MTSSGAKSAQFEWTEIRSKVALGLAEGKTQQQVADECAIGRRTVVRWLEHPEFAAEVDRLTLLTGISLRAERMRIVKRVVRQSVKDDQKVKTTKDILEWLKHAQSETNGTDLLEQLVASLTTSSH